MTPEQALGKTKIALMSRPDSTFFTVLCLSLTHKFRDDIKESGTDGTNLYYNPQYFLSLSMEQRLGLMLQLTMHVAYLHMDRMGGRDKNRWENAADYVVNQQLEDRHFKMPDGYLQDNKYKDLSAEEVYKLLENNPQDNPQNPSPNLMPPGEGEPGKDPGQASQELRDKVEGMLVKAATQAKMAGDKPGSIPGDIEIMLDNLLNPKLPWQTILRKYLNAYSKNDFSYKKANKRHFPNHILPSLHSESLGTLAVAFDASGSVSDEDFKTLVSETAGILRNNKPKEIQAIQFDTRIHSIDKVTNLNELMRIDFRGRGGTDVTEILEWSVKNKPQVMIVFTDGYFHMPNIKPHNDVIWMIHDNPGFTAPFGKVIHYSMK